MTPDHPVSPIERLAPEVRDYATDSFRLQNDLDRLHRVHQAGAPEAAILYCARILDVLAAEALGAVHLRASPNAFANLDTLQQYNLLLAPTLSWAHALRRLGNMARHVQRLVQPEDAEVSVLFVERCLEWFFLRFRYRSHRGLCRLTRHEEPFALTAGAQLRPFLVKIDAGDLSPCAAGGWSRAFLRTAALPAAAVEMMLDRGQYDAARLVLEAALAETPDDLRLNQLMGLHASRSGDLEEALRRLEPLRARYKDDGETAGITAGVYKRLWLGDKGNTGWLNKSHGAYRQGWDSSRQTNAYLGINAATTALWLGREPEARQIATDVRQLLQDRAAALRKRHADGADLVTNYWDQVTLAEAQVLLREFDAARHMYLAAFTKHPEQTANIGVSRKQLEAILKVLGPPFTADEFLAGPDTP